MVWHTKYNGQMITHFPEYVIPENNPENVPDDLEILPDNLENVPDLENLPVDLEGLPDLENLPVDELENEFASDTQIDHSIDSHNPETEPFDDA